MIRRIIDISHHEDPIDFAKVAGGGIVAIIAKATEGATWVDPAYQRFKRAAAKYNFLWGSYHFGTGADVLDQARRYLSIVRPTKRELVCLDFEENPTGSSMTLERARSFVALVNERIGTLPVLCGGAWLKEQLGRAEMTCWPVVLSGSRSMRTSRSCRLDGRTTCCGSTPMEHPALNRMRWRASVAATAINIMAPSRSCERCGPFQQERRDSDGDDPVPFSGRLFPGVGISGLRSPRIRQA